MRALPPLTLTLSNHRNWNAAVCGLAASAVAALAAWAIGWAPALGAVHGVGLAAAIAATIALAGTAVLSGTVHLRWDGDAWQLGEPARPVDVLLVLDLGGWMLLRCRCAETVTWLLLSRAHLRADWHALRCAVHAPRPAAVRGGRGEAASPVR